MDSFLLSSSSTILLPYHLFSFLFSALFLLPLLFSAFSCLFSALLLLLPLIYVSFLLPPYAIYITCNACQHRSGSNRCAAAARSTIMDPGCLLLTAVA